MKSAYEFTLSHSELVNFCDRVAEALGCTKKSDPYTYAFKVEAMGREWDNVGLEFTRRSARYISDALSYRLNARIFVGSPDRRYWDRTERSSWIPIPADYDLAVGTIQEQFDAFWRDGGERSFAYAAATAELDNLEWQTVHQISQLAGLGTPRRSYGSEFSIPLKRAGTATIKVYNREIPRSVAELNSWQSNMYVSELVLRSVDVPDIVEVLKVLNRQ